MRNKTQPIPKIRKATRADVAAFFGIALTTVDSWVRTGCPMLKAGRKGVGAEFDLLGVAKWRLVGDKKAAAVDPDTLPPQDRKAWYEGQARKLDLAVKAGELVPRSEMAQALATAFAAVTQDLLSTPDKMERRHGLPPEWSAIIDKEICLTIEALRGKLGGMAPEISPE